MMTVYHTISFAPELQTGMLLRCSKSILVLSIYSVRHYPVKKKKKLIVTMIHCTGILRFWVIFLCQGTFHQGNKLGLLVTVHHGEVGDARTRAARLSLSLSVASASSLPHDEGTFVGTKHQALCKDHRILHSGSVRQFTRVSLGRWIREILS